MPVGQALLAGTEGAAFGFFPILWIVINAIWVYNLTVATGHFDVLRRSFAKVSADQRIQAIIIAFCFGALLEALAGFGTPVAITVVMLMALGFRPIKAAAVALIANTAPVAFGALATPIVTLATVTSGVSDDPGSTVDTLGAMVGRQTPILAVFVPLVLVFVVDGRRGVRQTWLPALVCGVAFGLAQFVAANYISVPLTDIVASLVSAAVASSRCCGSGSRPRRCTAASAAPVEPEVRGGTGRRRCGRRVAARRPADRDGPVQDSDRRRGRRPTRRTSSSSRSSRSRNITAVKEFLAEEPWTYDRSTGRASTSLSAAGEPVVHDDVHVQLAAGGRHADDHRRHHHHADPEDLAGRGAARRTCATLRRAASSAIVTVMAVLALAYVMNLSGQTDHARRLAGRRRRRRSPSSRRSSAGSASR